MARTPAYQSGATSPPPAWRTRIREAREAKELNQRQTARLAGLSPENYHGYESGRLTPSVGTLLRIAQALEVSLDELVELEEGHGK